MGLNYWVRGIVLAFAALLPLVALGQKPATPSTSAQHQLLKEAERAYRYGLHSVAETMLGRLARSKGDEILKVQAERLAQRLELMTRLEAHRDDLPLIDSLNAPMEQLALSLERMLLDEAGRNHVGTFRLERGADSLWHFSFTPPLHRVRLESVSGGAADSATRLERIGGEYIPKAEGFAGLNSGIAMPVVLSDGVRIIFAQAADEGLGGYDLYFSRLNTDTGQYLRPTLLGLPYSSPANDYLLIYDEVLRRTLLVTDRFAPEGEVTIYRYRGCPRILGGNIAAEREGH